MSNEVKKDNAPHSTETPSSDQRPTTDDTDTARKKALAEKIMRDDREVLSKLAK